VLLLSDVSNKRKPDPRRVVGPWAFGLCCYAAEPQSADNRSFLKGGG